MFLSVETFVHLTFGELLRLALRANVKPTKQRREIGRNMIRLWNEKTCAVFRVRDYEKKAKLLTSFKHL